MGKTDDQHKYDIALYKCISRFFIEHQNAKLWFRGKSPKTDDPYLITSSIRTFCTRNILKIVTVITQGEFDWEFENMGHIYFLVSTNPKKPVFNIIKDEC